MISDPIECTSKKGYKYINVLCFTTQPMPIILPYVYLDEKENLLNAWLLINNIGKRAKHVIKNFEEVK